MLLQYIVHQLDGELARLKALRDVVAGLARSPAALRSLKPRIEQLLKAETQHEKEPRRRGRPRKTQEAAAPVSHPVKTPRLPRRAPTPKPMEPTALSKARSSGPVVVSATALAREREVRASAKAAPVPSRISEPEVRPEIFARELAARWLSPAIKG